MACSSPRSGDVRLSLPSVDGPDHLSPCQCSTENRQGDYPHRMRPTVAALVLPGVVTFDLGCVLAIFAPAPGPVPVPRPYDLLVCGPRRGRVATADGFAISVEH